MNFIESKYPIDDIKEILKYYECPSECDGYCCKQETIIISKDDYARLEKKSRKKARKIKPVEYWYEIPVPCPFLNKQNLCSAHDVNPWTCKLFPFAYRFKIQNGFIGLQPCPLGLIILRDYTIFTDLCIRDNKQIPESEKLRAIQRVYEDAKESISLSKKFRTQKSVRETYVPLNSLKPFVYFLQDFLSDEQVDVRDKLYEEFMEKMKLKTAID